MPLALCIFFGCFVVLKLQSIKKTPTPTPTPTPQSTLKIKIGFNTGCEKNKDEK